MPEDKSAKPPPQPQKKKKKKKKQKAEGTSTSPKDTDKPHPVSSEPLVLLTMGPPRGQLPKLKSPSKKDPGRLSEGKRKGKKSSPSLFSWFCTSNGSPVQSYVAQLSTQARESLRWEGALDDPQEEENRLELYRANRRQRYIQHREMQLKEMQEECGV